MRLMSATAVALAALSPPALACVQVQDVYLINNCPYPVVVRYDSGYGEMQSGLIRPGRAYAIPRKQGYGVNYAWCDTGGRHSWTCS